MEISEGTEDILEFAEESSPIDEVSPEKIIHREQFEVDGHVPGDVQGLLDDGWVCVYMNRNEDLFIGGELKILAKKFEGWRFEFGATFGSPPRGLILAKKA